jgi:hypothetical protein
LPRTELLDRPGYLVKDFIAIGMTKPVVDRLEVIDIDEQQPVLPLSPDRKIQEGAAVEQTGQRIRAGKTPGNLLASQGIVALKRNFT